MSEFTDYLDELFAGIAPVVIRRMFGGHGIYRDGLMFALVADDTLYLKVDADTESEFRARGLQPFEYTRQRKTVALSYFQAPVEALDDPRELAHWSELAWGAAQRAARRKKRPRSRR